MKMTIEVDAEIANKFLTENLEKLSPDEKKQIIKEVLVTSAKDIMTCTDGKIKDNLLIYYTYNSGYQLSSAAEKLIANFSCPEIEELKSLMVKDMIDHHRDIVNRAILDSLSNSIANSQPFRDAIRGVIHQIEWERNNHG